jgi:cytochrome c2
VVTQKRHWRTAVGFALVIAAGPAALASSDVGVPEAADVCTSCHAVRPGEPELEGPTLWGVVGRRIASAPDYAYSDALRRQQGQWDRATLDRFLASPQEFAPGVNMTLGGVRNAAGRKGVLDFLETLKPGGVLADDGAGESSVQEAGETEGPRGSD